jgi:hypothetical protein
MYFLSSESPILKMYSKEHGFAAAVIYKPVADSGVEIETVSSIQFVDLAFIVKCDTAFDDMYKLLTVVCQIAGPSRPHLHKKRRHVFVLKTVDQGAIMVSTFRTDGF